MREEDCDSSFGQMGNSSFHLVGPSKASELYSE